MCVCYNLTLHSFPKVVSISLFLNHILVNFTRRYVVVMVQSDVKETLIISKVKVHFPSIIQHKYFTFSKINNLCGLVVGGV